MLKKVKSWWVFVALILPPLLFLLLGTVVFHISLSTLIETKVLKIYYVFFLVFLVLKFFQFITSKKYTVALLLLGILVVLVYGAYAYENRFSALTFIAEGEGITGYYNVEKGLLTQVPSIPLEFKKIEADKCIVQIKSKEYELQPGEVIKWKGYNIKLDKIERVFFVQLKDSNKRILDEVYVKLMKGDRSDYFMFPLLPHRFYISEKSPLRKYWKQEGEDWRYVIEEKENSRQKKFHLLILRGKLTVVDQEIDENENIPFDGYYLSIKRGTFGAVIEIKKGFL